MDPAPDGTQIVGGAVPGRDGREPRRPLRVRRARERRSRGGRGSARARRASCAGSTCASIPAPPTARSRARKRSARMNKRLYVALAGLNAVAVLDARKPDPLSLRPNSHCVVSDGARAVARRPLSVRRRRQGRRRVGSSPTHRSQAHVARQGDARRAALQSHAARSAVQSGDSAAALEQAQRGDRSRRIYRRRHPELRRNARRSQGRFRRGPRQRRLVAEPLPGERHAEPPRASPHVRARRQLLRFRRRPRSRRRSSRLPATRRSFSSSPPKPERRVRR